MDKHLKDEITAEARAVVDREAAAVSNLARQFDDAFADVVDLLLNCTGHVLVTGAGTSHAVAQRMAHLLSCSGTPALCIDAGAGLHGGSGAIKAGDVVYIISKGGQSREINQFAQIGKDRGAVIIAQTEAPDSPLGRMSDAVLKVKAEDGVDPFDMVATGSSLVNAAAGDALCAVLLKLRGYSREDFGQTHPGGVVGMKLKESDS
jgi:D-arabinose 5-phosphate isomerase GutQ